MQTSSDHMKFPKKTTKHKTHTHTHTHTNQRLVAAAKQAAEQSNKKMRIANLVEENGKKKEGERERGRKGL